MKCQHCYKIIEAQRKTKKFCNGTCRKAFYRDHSVANEGDSVAVSVTKAPVSVAERAHSVALPTLSVAKKQVSVTAKVRNEEGYMEEFEFIQTSERSEGGNLLWEGPFGSYVRNPYTGEFQLYEE